MFKPCIACGKQTTEQFAIPYGDLGQSTAHGDSVQSAPICSECDPYLQQLLREPILMLDYVRFISQNKVEGIKQCDEAFACKVSGQDDITNKLNDFNLFCQFVGKRVYARRFRESMQGTGRLPMA